MNNADLLLVAANQLHGPRTVQTRVRPPRVVYLIPVSSPEVLEQAIRSACASWGGEFFWLVPCNEEHGLQVNGSWLSALEGYDPDFVVAPIDLSERTKQALQSLGAAIVRWENPQATVHIHAPLLYSRFEADQLTPDKSDIIVIDPEIDRDSELYWPIIARWGLSSEALVKQVAGIGSRQVGSEPRQVPSGRKNSGRESGTPARR